MKIALDCQLGCTVMNSEFNGRNMPEQITKHTSGWGPRT